MHNLIRSDLVKAAQLDQKLLKIDVEVPNTLWTKNSMYNTVTKGDRSSYSPNRKLSFFNSLHYILKLEAKTE